MLPVVFLGSLLGVTLLHIYLDWPLLKVVHFIFIDATFLSVLLLNRFNLTLYRKSVVFLLFCCVGWGWSYYQVAQKIKAKQAFEYSLDQVSGEVVSISYSKGTEISFDLAMSQYAPWKIRLYWASPSVVLHTGDVISIRVKLKKPSGMVNPGGFDQEKQGFIDSIVATGNVLSLESHHLASNINLSTLRQRVSERIAHVLGEKPLVGVIQAMTVGIRTSISADEWKVFQATGTSHVVAISGLHVGLIATLCAVIVSYCVRRHYRLTCYFPAQSYGAIAAMGGALLYSAAAGFSIPTQRACIMVLIAMMARLRKQAILSWQTLALAGVIVIFYDPFSVLQMGFWLSFGCVAALIMGRSHYHSSNRFRRWVFPQCIVFVALLPLSVLFFHQVSIVSPLANLFFLPIVSFIIVPFSLLGALGSSICLHIAHGALSLAWPVLNALATMKWSVYSFPQVSGFTLLLACLGVLLLLLPRGLPCRQLGWCGLLPIFFVRTENLPEGVFQFTLLDVGQGLAAVIQTKQHALLYDAGPVYGEYSDAGGRVIQPFLRAYNIKKLDKIIISHTDLDHRGGLRSLKHFPYEEIVSSEPQRLKEIARKCWPGEEWEWDGVHFIFLNPIVEHKKRNNLSCVLKVSVNGKSVLLTGDIEALAEKEMIKQFKENLKSDVLVVPHHGSLTSSSPEFIQAVSARYALFSVGRDNRYGFPRLDVMSRYQNGGMITALTWQTGAILFRLGDQDELTSPIYWRDTFKRYWNTS